ncbi:hypothetical protein O7A70_31710 [Mesorhizobium sp. Cs1299R1N1]|uniref:hypothetical protein n=1 Tax=Mesorhizobium sp. Cs1299R1N1 TaxID=3015172 RepID=UPI00301D8D3E
MNSQQRRHAPILPIASVMTGGTAATNSTVGIMMVLLFFLIFPSCRRSSPEMPERWIAPEHYRGRRG